MFLPFKKGKAAGEFTQKTDKEASIQPRRRSTQGRANLGKVMPRPKVTSLEDTNDRYGEILVSITTRPRPKERFPTHHHHRRRRRQRYHGFWRRQAGVSQPRHFVETCCRNKMVRRNEKKTNNKPIEDKQLIHFHEVTNSCRANSSEWRLMSRRFAEVRHKCSLGDVGTV